VSNDANDLDLRLVAYALGDLKRRQRQAIDAELAESEPARRALGHVRRIIELSTFGLRKDRLSEPSLQPPVAPDCCNAGRNGNPNRCPPGWDAWQGGPQPGPMTKAAAGALTAVVSALGRAWAAIPDWVGLDPFNHPFKWTNPGDAWEDDESWLPSASQDAVSQDAESRLPFAARPAGALGETSRSIVPTARAPPDEDTKQKRKKSATQKREEEKPSDRPGFWCGPTPGRPDRSDLAPASQQARGRHHFNSIGVST